MRILVAALCLHATAASGADLERGERAYHRGEYQLAAELWRPAAETGDSFAQFGMGLLYYSGRGVEQDLGESVRWFRLSSERGYGPAQFNLGNAYKHGRGVVADEKQAAHWWRLAAEQDYAVAQYNLALQYYYGLGVGQSEEEAQRWFRRAADNGHERAIALFESGGGSKAPADPATIERPASAPQGAPGDAAERRGEAWILQQDPAGYTLQILASQRESAIHETLERLELPNPIAYFRFERDGVEWYALIHGSFAGPSAARAAVDGLPPKLREGGPWARPFRDIHALIGAE